MALPVYGDYPAPPGYELVSRPNTGLIVGGLALFGASYAGGLIYAGANGFDQGLGWTAVPLVGPWIAVASHDFSCTIDADPFDPLENQRAAEECQQQAVTDATVVASLAAVGFGQLVGATLTVVGIVDTSEMWVRSDLAGVEMRFDVASRPGGGWLVASGRF